MLDLSSGVAAVGVLLVLATLAQIAAGFMQLREEDTGMTNNLRVIGTSLMMTVSSVAINVATASSPVQDFSAL
jgi:hypothetical protein